MTMSSVFRPVLFSSFVATIIMGCTPKIYVVDRQTVLEDEAAGEWPQFEKDLLAKSAARSPTPFSKTATTRHKTKLYNILNGELVSQKTEAKSPAGLHK